MGWAGTERHDGREARRRSWIRQIAGGDRDALAALYDDLSDYVYGVVLRVLRDPTDAEEVMLDIFMAVWRRAGDFDEARGNVSQWLTVLARSRAIDRLRSRTLRRSVETNLAEPAARAAEGSPEETVEARWRRRHIQAALANLPQEQREAIELAYFFGYSHSELAALLGEPLGTVKTRIRLGMMKLRDDLQALESDFSPAA